MGRKIPAKKHRGVKDPLEQQARRLQSVKGKINAPPADPDDQPVPRSLERLFAPRPAPAHRPPRPVNHKHGNRTKGAGGERNPVSRLRALPGESAREFSLRINSAVRALHSAGPLHYPVEAEEDEEDSKGARMAELRERRARKQRRAAAGRPRVSAPALPPPLSRTQKLALKKKNKMEKANEKAAERGEVRFERVAFGDVAHAPPALAPLRGRAGAPALGAPRPGRRGLLLSSLLAGGTAPPAAEVLRRERARLDAVAAYRALKAERATSSNTRQHTR